MRDYGPDQVHAGNARRPRRDTETDSLTAQSLQRELRIVENPSYDASGRTAYEILIAEQSGPNPKSFRSSGETFFSEAELAIKLADMGAEDRARFNLTYFIREFKPDELRAREVLSKVGEVRTFRFTQRI
jgi:hypothetical protein